MQSLVSDERSLKSTAASFFLADVCRAATIGSLKTDAVGGAIEKLGDAPGEMLGLMAARPKELSNEGPDVRRRAWRTFTYSVLKGLGGAADSNDDQAVDAGELIQYVQGNVSKLTNNKQHARDFGNMANETKLSDLSKSGIQLARIKIFFDSRTGDPLLIAQAAGTSANPAVQAQNDIDAFQSAIAARHILPDDPRKRTGISLTGSAPNSAPSVCFLRRMRFGSRLKTRLQQVLLKYLSGGQTPQVRRRFRQWREVYGSSRAPHARIALSSGTRFILLRPFPAFR